MTEKLRLVKTCSACPEQYDVYRGKEQVGYMRLRHGEFYAQCLLIGDIVYSSCDLKGDGLFDNEDERRLHLSRGCKAILDKLTQFEHIDDNYYIEEEK